MKFKLVYADAENLGKVDFVEAVTSLRSNLENNECIVGKFYGGLSSLNGMVAVGRDLGFTFIETSSMTTRKKNLADMSLTVDCLSDVLSQQFSEISEVVLLSQDCDFLPLVYKLKSFGFKVSTPLYVTTDERTEETIIEDVVKSNEVNLLACESLLRSPIDLLLDFSNEMYSKETLTAYYAKKRDRFLRCNTNLTDNQITMLKAVPITDFCFKSVIQVVGFSSVELLVDLLKQYSQKFFGKCLTLQDNYAMISEMTLAMKEI